MCRLTLGEKDNPHNQHYRICVAVLTSQLLKDEIEYPKQSTSTSCSETEVSFKSTEAKDMTEGRTYKERIIECESRYVSRIEKISLYVSRAYLSNVVFVYRRDSLDHRMYLVNMLSDVSITDELNSFDFFED